MGSKNSKPNAPPINFDPSEWVQQNFVSNDPGLSEFGNFKTLKNRTTDQLIDKYQETFISDKDYQDYLLSYEWRKDEKHIVGAYHIESKNRNKYCSTTYHVDIYIERPKNRLSDFSDVPFPDTMYCLKAMLIGYTKLFEHIGAFPIKEEQVCIDQQGNIRVWLNKDLSKNYPEQWEIQPKSKSLEQQQQQMVSQIISIVDKNTDPQLERKPTFIQFYQQNRNVRKIGFQQAVHLVQQYTQSNDAVIPEYFISVMQVYEHQQGLYQADMQQHSGNQNDDNGDQFGELTEREIERRRNQLFAGSQVQKLTDNSRKSGSNHPSQLENSDRFNNNQLMVQNDNSNSMGQNRNKGETYRLSGLSRLDDSQKITPTYQPLKNYNPVNNQGPNNNIYRPSEAMSNINNYSQMSYNNAPIKTSQVPVWVSHKPQQAYIPSSPTYMNLQPNTQQPNLLTQFNQSPTIRTQNTNRVETLQPSNNTLGRNYSISQKQQQHNNSNIGGEDYLNLKFQRELQEEIQKDQHDIQEREHSVQQLKYKPLPRNNQRQSNSHIQSYQAYLKNTQSENSKRTSQNENNLPANQQKTAQFIQPNSSQHRRSSPHANSASNFASISKSNSAQGFTIIIKSPSQQNISYAPHPQSPQYSTYNVVPQPVRMLKNNSQPYLPSYPAYAPPQFIPTQPIPITFPQFHPKQNYQSITNFQIPRNRPPESSAFVYSPRIFSSAGEARSNKQNSSHIQTSYCTLKQQVPLDPEIARDLLLYI